VSRAWRYWAVESAAGSALVAAGLALVFMYGVLWASGTTRHTVLFSKDTIVYFFIDVVLVVGLQIFSGNSGILSFGHTAFIGTAAYAASLLTIDTALKSYVSPGLPHFFETHSVGLLPATMLAVAFVGVLALATGLVVLRLDGASAVIAILSLLLIANVVFGAWTSVTRGAGGLYGMPESTTIGWAFGAAVLAVIVARLFKDSRTGLQLQGSREDAFSAAAVGVHVRAARLRAWLLSAMVSGVGGALFALKLGAITPSTFYLQETFTIVVMLVIGGMTTVSGAVAGVAVVTFVREVLKPYESKSLDLGVMHVDRLTNLTNLALVALILAVLYFRREGIVGRRELDESLRRLVRRAHGQSPHALFCRRRKRAP
jgi:branched-chain amino acid transport system permease protein